MLEIPTKYLLLLNGLLWTAIGVRIALTGVDYYGRLAHIPWWYFLLSALVFAGFWFMFTGVVRKYAARILSMTAPRTSIFKMSKSPGIRLEVPMEIGSVPGFEVESGPPPQPEIHGASHLAAEPAPLIPGTLRAGILPQEARPSAT